MSQNTFDFIIVGHGLAGSVLTDLLIKEGYNILVIDRFDSNSSSQVAAGLVNPITGRRVVKSWMAETLLPFADKYYRSFEKENETSLYYSMDILEVVHSIKDVNEWMSRAASDDLQKYFIDETPDELYKNKISDYKKMFRINSSLWMNIPLFIDVCKNQLIERTSLLKEEFDISELSIKTDYIKYRNNISTQIIFCEGSSTTKNSLWNWLPFVPAKGEILTIESRDLPENFILISGIFLIPLGNHRFRTGATYEWDFKDNLPSEKGKRKLIDSLNHLLKIPYEIIDHRAGIRPTVKDRRPIIGKHPEYKNVFIFNGMGTKGVQLAPFFADHFVKYLKGDGKLMEEVDVARFDHRSI